MISFGMWLTTWTAWGCL